VLASFLERRADRAQALAEGRPVPADVRRIMTQREAMALGQFVRETCDQPRGEIHIKHTATAVTMRYPEHLPRCIDVDDLAIHWLVKLGTINRFFGMVWVATDVRDPETLRQVLLHAVKPVPDPPLSPEEQEDRMAWDQLYQPHTYTYLPSTTWHAQTAAASDVERGTMLARLFAPLAGTDWQGAGTVAVSEIGVCSFNDAMKVTQWGEATDSEISLTVHSADGATSGWSGHAHRNWNHLDPERVAHDALATATQQLNASRLEPGRYTTILSATAVGQFLQQMAELYDATHWSPFSNPGEAPTARGKLGERLFDPRITLTTDPTDPEGGDFPFFPDGVPYPSGKVTWVEHGVIKRRSVGVGDGFQLGLTPLRDPKCVRMSGGPTSVEEMIANCERGIYVHRLATITITDPWSGTMEGFTRDGCLLIMDGKIKRPVKDFRFYESPFLAFNRVLALGTPRRIAFGFTPPNGEQWPYPPVIAPPMLVRDFNFSALADNA